MKTTFAALALSLAGAALAAPTKPFPYSVDEIKLYHLVESDTWDLTVAITERDASGNAVGSASCHTAWIDGSDYVARQPCESPDHYLSLPYGARDPSQWTVKVDGPQVAGEGLIQSGPKYQCGPYDGDIGNIDLECRTTNGGWFFLHETEAS